MRALVLAGAALAAAVQAGACTGGSAYRAPAAAPSGSFHNESMAEPMGYGEASTESLTDVSDRGSIVLTSHSTASVARTATATSAPMAPAASAQGQPGGGQPASASHPQAQAQALQQEQLVVEGWLRIEVEDVSASAAAIRAQVERSGGRITSEQIDGAASVHGGMQLKLPPAQVPGFLAWLEEHGIVRSKRIQSTDVSRQLFDQQIALDNLEHTLRRLHAVLDREGLAMQEILAIEAQMTRLRGDIERIKGEKRYLEHRVAFATLSLDLRGPEPDEPVILGGRAKAKLYPGPRVSSLVLLDADGRQRTRLGAGVQVRFLRHVPFELDIFEDADGAGRGVLATTGGVLYSDFLGRGHRRFLNPYLELRVGYAHLNDHAFAFGAGAGVELFKHRYVQVDVNSRILGLLGDAFEPVLVTGASAVFAF